MNRPTIYNHITNSKNYKKAEWLNEACSFFIGQLVYEHGTEKILASKFEGIEEICNFANGLRNYLKNGTGQQQGSTSNQLRRNGSESLEVEPSRRGHSRGRNEQSTGNRQEAEEVNYRITDPLEAIRNAADSWKKDRADRASDINDMKDYSAKGVYEQRINSIGFVTTESYQDAMAGLKVSQNAIAKDKDIPDSQNA